MTDHKPIVDDRALDILFRTARTYRGWKDKAVSDVLIHACYDLARMGPTSFNSSPMRVTFVKSKAAKERLKPWLDKGNVEQTMAAPVTAIVAHDLKFYDKLSKLSPQLDMNFVGKDKLITLTAMRNGSLQGGYFIMAARALGLDCGPMSGFNREGVRKEFFPEREEIEVNFLCNIGYGDPGSLRPRAARLDFDEACEIV